MDRRGEGGQNRPMRAILIDPEPSTLSVTEIELDARPGRVIAAVEAVIEAAAGTPASLRRGHDLWYADLFLAATPKRFFLHRDLPHPYAGKCVILGEARGGSAARLTLDQVRRDLVHMLRVEGRLFPIDANHPSGIDPTHSMTVPG